MTEKDRYKKITILHSNDMHGDFSATEKNEEMVGGISRLSGYVQKVRKEEKNVLYAIAGDMFRGSLIDSEYKGISTIELMNMLTPDVATIGNHEVDYGVAHLLFLEKCARFPIINANIYIKSNHVRLFNGHYVKKIDGMKILFIGILTEEVLQTTKKEAYIGALVDVYDAAQEIGKICDRYRASDIDFTVVLTHIGINADRELASILNPNWGVDLIIGGHSHTLMDAPEVVNGIPIVQAASGTGQIGRFDITVDTQNNCIHDYTWNLIPIDDDHCPRDKALEVLLDHYQKGVDEKYSRYITRLADTYTHPARNRETECGRLFADICLDSFRVDIVMLGSGSLRNPEFGPIVTYRELVEMVPFDDSIIRLYVTGKQLKRMMDTVFQPAHFEPDVHCEFYQYSTGFSVKVSRSKKCVEEISLNGEPIDDDRIYKICTQEFHYINLEEVLGVTEDEVKQNGMPKVIATSLRNVAEEYMLTQELIKAPEDERWVYVD